MYREHKRYCADVCLKIFDFANEQKEIEKQHLSPETTVNRICCHLQAMPRCIKLMPFTFTKISIKSVDRDRKKMCITYIYIYVEVSSNIHIIEYVMTFSFGPLNSALLHENVNVLLKRFDF